MLILTVMVVVRSNTETDLATELAGTAILMFIGAVRKEDLRSPVEAPAPQAPQAPVHVNRRHAR
jgi:hypothetical protein